ncbi:hypothetical protein [Nonomuraea sp. NPDC005692]|uniref:hypothetical protein n=1 Tax=Nonomuraea sp. NPDC005692 TaxID=3157168 RepID=UPI0033CE0B96
MLYAGRLTEEKGFDRIHHATAMKRLHLSIPAPRAQYVSHPVFQDRSRHPHIYLGRLPAAGHMATGIRAR